MDSVVSLEPCILSMPAITHSYDDMLDSMNPETSRVEFSQEGKEEV